MGWKKKNLYGKNGRKLVAVFLHFIAERGYAILSHFPLNKHQAVPQAQLLVMKAIQEDQEKIVWLYMCFKRRLENHKKIGLFSPNIEEKNVEKFGQVIR